MKKTLLVVLLAFVTFGMAGCGKSEEELYGYGSDCGGPGISVSPAVAHLRVGDVQRFNAHGCGSGHECLFSIDHPELASLSNSAGSNVDLKAIRFAPDTPITLKVETRACWSDIMKVTVYIDLK